jgi:hypothetical protein
MPYRILCKMQGVTSPRYRNFLHYRENFCPTDRPTPSIPTSCYLHRRSDCHRVGRSSSRAGLSSRCGPALFTAHRYRLYINQLVLVALYCISDVK